MAEGFDIYDVEYGMLNGKVRRTWPREAKYKVIGSTVELSGSGGASPTRM
jgi:hypothetical protein